MMGNDAGISISCSHRGLNDFWHLKTNGVVFTSKHGKLVCASMSQNIDGGFAQRENPLLKEGIRNIHIYLYIYI